MFVAYILTCIKSFRTLPVASCLANLGDANYPENSDHDFNPILARSLESQHGTNWFCSETWISYTNRVTAAEYRHALDVLPYGNRLPGAVYLIDTGDDPHIPSLLRITVAGLRTRSGR
jgi:hypothetical protein